nr:transposase [Brucella oryzae]
MNWSSGIEALGRSRGGFTTKLHARCDAKGRPLGFVLMPGQTHDTQGFAPLFRMISDRVEAFLADKGYDADAIRDKIASAKVEADGSRIQGRSFSQRCHPACGLRDSALQKATWKLRNSHNVDTDMGLR